MRNLRRQLAALALGVALSGCAGSSEPEQAYVPRPVDELYNEAKDLLDAGRFVDAAQTFEEVERQHPYSEWATRGQTLAAYAYYEADEYDQAIAAAERFLELHPGHKDAPYALYLISLAYYEQISDVGRDQEMTDLALERLGQLARRFPDSDYARDAQLKIDLARDHLAGKEMEIGRYYQERSQWVAAINRFRTVVEQYQTTTQTPEALHRLTESYLALGLRREAQAAAAVLGHNFPDDPWYERSYALLTESDLEPLADAQSGSWLDNVFAAGQGLVDRVF